MFAYLLTGTVEGRSTLCDPSLGGHVVYLASGQMAQFT